LAVQGGFAAHERVITRMGHDAVAVRTPDQLEGLTGLVLPGGESTTQLKLIQSAGLSEPLNRFARRGYPILATCAGLILAAREVFAPNQDSFGWLDLSVRRNAYGRQLDSFEATSCNGRPLLFIRAPRIVRVGPDVEVCDEYEGEAILVRQGQVWGASFHPELTNDTSVHEMVFGEAH
jgi:5'-phosphate synthase pdxT subunit